MIYLSIGRREQGKTTLAYWMAQKVPQRAIFDPRGMIRRGETLTTITDLREGWEELIDRERAELVYTPDGEVQAGFDRFVGHARGWVKSFPRRPLALLIDEAAFVSTETTAFMWILRCSSRAHVHVFLTAHRPSDIRTGVRAIADHWLLFAARQEHDLRVIQERCSEAVVAEVERLKPREFIHWDDARGQYRAFRDPSAWYVDLDAHGARAEPPGPPGLDELPSEPGAKMVDQSKLFG